MKLEKLKSQTTWAEASQSINANSDKILEALVRIESEVNAGAGGIDQSALQDYLEDNDYINKDNINQYDIVTTTDIIEQGTNIYNQPTNVIKSSLVPLLNTGAGIVIKDGAITLNADVDTLAFIGSGNNVALSLKESGITAGTYTKTTFDIYGRAISGSSLIASDIPTLSISKISGLQSALDSKVNDNDFADKFANEMASWFVKEGDGIKPANSMGFFSESYISAKGKKAGTGGGGSGLNEELLWSLLGNEGTEQIAKNHLTSALSGYATESWVSNKGYATQSWVISKSYATTTDLDNRINGLINGAPAAYDTLKEIADVLAGNVNSIGDILTSLEGKASKATTLAGYGITDAKIANGVITLGSNTITPLTSHQTIYNLTIQKNGVDIDTFDPNGAKKTINISDVASASTLSSHTSSTSNPHSVTKSQVGLGNVENTKLSTWAGSSNITTLGTITTGIWNGTAIGNDYLVNSAISIAGQSVSLGGTLTVKNLQTSLGLGSLAYKSSLTANDIPSLDWSKITSGQPTTLSGYGITDAKIVNGVITLGSNTITPLTSHQTIYDLTIQRNGVDVDTFDPNGAKKTINISDVASASTLSGHTGNTSNPHSVTKSQVGLGNVENTKLSTWSGTSNITTLGTITTGTWNGTAIGNSYLANSSISIAGQSVSLGGSITAATLKTQLGLGSLAYKSSLTTSDVGEGTNLYFTDARAINAVKGGITFTGQTTHSAGLSATTGSFSSTLTVSGTTTLKSTTNIEGFTTITGTSGTGASGYNVCLRTSNASHSAIECIGGNYTMGMGCHSNGSWHWWRGTSSPTSSTNKSYVMTYNGTTWSFTGVLYASTGIYSAGYVSAKSSSSDIRLKKDLTVYSALAIIKNHRSVKYHWNENAKNNAAIFNTDAWQYGLIAQELQANHPQLVGNDFGDYLTIHYDRLIPIAWRGIQELDERTESLEEKVNRLEQENGRLKEEVTILTNKVYGYQY